VRASVALRRASVVATVVLALAACQRQAPSPPAAGVAEARPAGVARHVPDLVIDLERRTFDFFWELGNPANGLVPDRWPTPSASSIAAVGFGLTAYGVGVERGWIGREQAEIGRAHV